MQTLHYAIAKDMEAANARVAELEASSAKQRADAYSPTQQGATVHTAHGRGDEPGEVLGLVRRTGHGVSPLSRYGGCAAVGRAQGQTLTPTNHHH